LHLSRFWTLVSRYYFVYSLVRPTWRGLGTYCSPCGLPSWLVHFSSWMWVLLFCSLFFPFLVALVNLWLQGFVINKCQLLLVSRTLTLGISINLAPSIRRNFLVYFEGAFCSWISLLLENWRDFTPTPWEWEQNYAFL